MGGGGGEGVEERGWRVSGHPTGPAAPGQGQGAVVALLVPCQTSPLRPLVVLHPDVSQSIHSLMSTHRRAPNPLSKMPGCPQPPNHPQSHNRSSLVSHTLWHVLGISECVPEGICAMCRRGVVPYCVICAVYAVCADVVRHNSISKDTKYFTQIGNCLKG